MAIYVHITKDCHTEAQKANLESRLLDTQNQVEETQNHAFFSRLSSLVLKKNITRQFRLIAYRHEIDDDVLIVFLRLLQRRPKDYPKMLKNIIKDPKPYDDDKLRRIHATLTDNSPVSPLSSPNDDERAWLYEVLSPSSLETKDIIIFETKSWVECMNQDSNKYFWETYRKTLESMLDDTSTIDQPKSVIIPIHWDRANETGIAYHYRVDLDVLLLVKPMRRSDVAPQEIAPHLARATDRTALSKLAIRSYPSYIVTDHDAWTAIQNDNESNLALSPEEAQLIASINAPEADNHLPYPLFINGLAGSGKSTILQYIASKYIHFALRRQTNQLPLYLTASDDLLKRARQTVHLLITTNHERLVEAEKIDPDKIASLLKSSFWTIREFLYSLLPPEIQSRFRRDRYVNYPSFRNLWATDFARRGQTNRLSAEVSWHVIRSLIKGLRSDPSDELHPDDFELIPRRRRSVSFDLYTEIYDHVWNGWYKQLCDDDGRWDDQDLAAHVLDIGVPTDQERAAIFCDEAQDLTSADLDVIFQLSLYGRRALQPHELQRVPIVFAGDPLQTINPTGFQWDAVKAYFHDRFRATLHVQERAGIEISYRPLQLNYRSDPGIVKFCNLLQFVRTALLKHTGIRPQDSWWSYQKPVPPTWFSIDDPATESHMRDHPEYIKLIDCDEGEETEYVKQDPLLSRIADLPEEETYRNIMSPARAKGLEFSAVVLYRFSKRMVDDFDLLLTGKVDLSDPKLRLRWEYFFNRLYVAVSRARDRLIVVDNKHAIVNFWKMATKRDVYNELMAKIKHSKIWESQCQLMFPGTPEAWDEGRPIDQKAQADRYAEQGRTDGDSYLLRQAGLTYRSLDEKYMADMCFAEANRMEGKWEIAGRMYWDNHKHEEAFDCYWAGAAWPRLNELTAARQSLAGRLESRAADYMAGGLSVDSFVDRLISEATSSSMFRRMRDDSTWSRVLCKVADRVANAPDEVQREAHSDSQSALFDMLDRFAREGVRIRPSSLATLAYRACHFAKAVQYWEDNDLIQSSEYVRAKSYVTPFPDCLEYLRQLADSSGIVQRWSDERITDSALRKLDSSIAHVVADAALDQEDFTLAVTIIRAHPDGIRVGRLLNVAIRSGRDDIVCEGANEATRLFVRNRQWNDAVRAESLVSISEIANVQSMAIRAPLDRQRKNGSVLRTLVFELANSTGLVSDAPTIVASFLQQRFIDPRRERDATAADHEIPVEIIGAAIERSGKIVDALQYYENLLKDEHATRYIRMFAASRLIFNLKKHVTYLERRGKQRDAQQQRTRADKLRREWRIDDGDLPEFPEIRRPMGNTSKAMVRDSVSQPFWDSPSLDELERLQNVKPVANIEDLSGTWPGDDDDGFEDTIDALRHPHADQS